MPQVTKIDVKTLCILNTNTHTQTFPISGNKRRDILLNHRVQLGCSPQRRRKSEPEPTRTPAHRGVFWLWEHFWVPPSASSDLQELQNDLATPLTEEQRAPGSMGSLERQAQQLQGAQSSTAAQGEDRNQLLHMAGSFCPSVQNETPQKATACRTKQAQVLELGCWVNPPVTAAPAPLDRDALIRQQKQARVWGWRCYL